jgi:hypothetical protein
MTHHNESVDETIDRVAAQLTMVPADAALAARVAGQRGVETANPFRWQRLAFGAAAVTAVAIVALLVPREPRNHTPADIARAPSAVVRTEAPRAAVAAEAAPAAVTPLLSVNRRRRSASPPPLPEMPQIEALSSPVLLTVETLTKDTLTVTPVDLAPLDLSGLTVAPIDERDQPKE